MNSGDAFVGVGFCATFVNADPTAIAPMGVVSGLAGQAAFGLTSFVPEIRPWLQRVSQSGLRAVTWAWCDAGDLAGAQREGRFHAEVCRDLGSRFFIGNPEASYDAHGDSDSPKYGMCDEYVRAFTQRAQELGLTFDGLGLTTTPNFASSQLEGAQRGWVMMPQAFTGASAEATVAQCFDHFTAWGWPQHLLRPLVQTYRTNGKYPAVQPYLDDSAGCQVGVAPYTVEQALDEEGKQLLKALKPATFRAPVAAPVEPPDENGGTIVMPSLTAEQVPYTGQLGSDATKHKHSSPTIQALKRMLGRLRDKHGNPYLTWKGTEFTDDWPAGGAFDQAFGRWSLDVGLNNDHVYGEQKWKQARLAVIQSGSKKGEYGLDSYAQDLIRDEHAASQTSDEQRVRDAITDFCKKAEANEDAWHYSQHRPIDVSVDPSAGSVTSDCSGLVIQAYHYAKRTTGLDVPDPAKQSFSGYGNTSTYEDDHAKVGAPYKVGDLAHYDGHVCICRKAGDAQTATWTSHGQEAGPDPVSLHYRDDLRFVVRPPLL